MLVGHSMGNYVIVNTLWRMRQEDKDKMIARYIALAPPYIGAPIVASFYLGMDNQFAADLNFF